MSWFALALSVASAPAVDDAPYCQRELVVLGAGQDAGAPQIGNAGDDGPPLLPTSIALVDRELGKRYLFEATPSITEQLHMLDRIAPPAVGAANNLGLDGVLLTHAHMGHYVGLAHLGFEAADPKGVPIFAMPRMAEFLRANGPWSQLVELGNIEIVEMANGELTPISDTFGVWPMLVPHRDEFSETVGFVAMTPGKTTLFVPDLDRWSEWEEQNASSLAELVNSVDYAFVDATFWDDNELGRDMSAIPHPRVKATMDTLQHLPLETRAKVHFIHYNHSNPIRDPGSDESREVAERGFNIARRGDRHCLD